MFEFLEDAFYDWTPVGIAVWLGISISSIYVAWFVAIPSAVGISQGFPTSVKYMMTIAIPAITWYLIQNKEWTANMARKVGKR